MNRKDSLRRTGSCDGVRRVPRAAICMGVALVLSLPAISAAAGKSGSAVRVTTPARSNAPNAPASTPAQARGR
jgi:hypothetical protein